MDVKIAVFCVLATIFMVVAIYPGLHWVYDKVRTIFMWFVMRKVKVYHEEDVLLRILFRTRIEWRKRTKEDKIVW